MDFQAATICYALTTRETRTFSDKGSIPMFNGFSHLLAMLPRVVLPWNRSHFHIEQCLGRHQGGWNHCFEGRIQPIAPLFPLPHKKITMWNDSRVEKSPQRSLPSNPYQRTITCTKPFNCVGSTLVSWIVNSVGSWKVPCCRLLNFLPEINEDIGSLWQQHRLLQDQLRYRYAANFQSTLKARAVALLVILEPESLKLNRMEKNSKSLSLSVNLTMPMPKDFRTAV